jgi:hypothetical protein
MDSRDEPLLMRIISQYNHNQEDYNRNMASLIDIMQQQQQSRRSNDVYTFEFGVSDAASALLSLFDPSRNLSSSSYTNVGLSETDISCGTVVFNYVREMPSLICPITLEPVQQGDSVMQINNCRHRFKESALRRWFDNHQRCPVCRGIVHERFV